MASNLKGLPPLPTLQTPLINEPDSVSQDQSLQHHAKITHTGSMPVISLQPQHPLRKSKRQTLINAQLTKLHKSNIDLNEIKRKDIAILNHQSPQDSPLPSPDVIKKPEWLKTAPEIQPQGKLPRGASFVFATELSALETELKSAKLDLKTWGEVQAKALESLVCANKDLKSYKPPKPPVSPQDVTGVTGKPGTGTGRNTASGKKAPPPPKSASKSLKASPTKNPRTGIVIGEENCNLLAAKAAAAAVSAPPVLDGTLTLVVPNTPPPPPPPKPEPERWPEALYDVNFKVTPMYIISRISINKSDWVAKVIKERTQHLQKIEELEKRVAIAARDMEWVNTHRMYGKSKSMMVSTVFSDYSHEKGLKIPVLGAPERQSPFRI
ncbi:hypothetical protein BCR33DRAFT_788765 [Rhizoclosmatium globosum]|uniref:Uncharacterized protein n=1 Tax=Rhizoclosmatium globosum TaxID=329046 RepID=A0A1Y2BV65_9FUNG|nr:hypothetical protein BCR33DRAFT_788765 [Rhizoclosmatium globosum]|eukprot:ORY38517.1 hypothetical protein BCR33DRAFT_788765 [Rhizoclosmatium globosum]